MAKPAKGSKLYKQMKAIGKVDHKTASIAGAVKTIDNAAKAHKTKIKTGKPKVKKTMGAYNFFYRETMAQVKTEGVAPGPASTTRIAELWQAQKAAPEGIAKWEKQAADAKAAAAAAEARVAAADWTADALVGGPAAAAVCSGSGEETGSLSEQEEDEAGAPSNKGEAN